MSTDKETIALLSEIKSLAPKGFAIAFHINFSTPKVLFQAYPKEWTQLYSEKGMVLNDPIVHWTFNNLGVIKWSELDNLDTAGVLEAARSFDMNYGLACAIDSEGSRSVAGFCRDDREFTEAETQKLMRALERLVEITDPDAPVSLKLQEHMRKLSILLTHP